MNVKLKKTICSALAASISLVSSSPALMQPANSTIAAAEMQYEFEDGKTDGGKIYNEGWKGNTQEDGSGEDMDLTGFSGKGFSYLDQKGTTVSIDVDVPQDGLYEMDICYCEPYDTNKKVQYLNINGVNQGEVSFRHNLSFSETSGGIVNLKKGKNTIEFKAYWGYTFFDYIKLRPAPENITNLSPDRTLSNPKASDSAKRLFSYLCDQYGSHILSGQQEYCGSHNYNLWNDPDNYIKDNEKEFEYIAEVTGKQPAIRGIDFLVYNSDSTWDDNAAERTIQWVNEYKGIATVTWHWNVPCAKNRTERAFYVESTGNTPFTTFSVKKALTEGTWENEILMEDIDAIAKQLTKLKEADVPILWRPLHEAEGAWFWWGAEGAEPCKELYHLLYDKLTNEYGLDNLIWVWTGYTYETSADWYPGDDVVDLIGYDKYNAVDGKPNLSSISSTFYSLVQSTNGKKMVTMSENDSIPSLENLVNDKAAWLYFCPWYMNYLTSPENNPADNLKEIYTSDYCITLDELPDLKKYPISESSPSTDTTKPVTTQKATSAVTTSVPTTAAVITTTASTTKSDIIWGDANGDKDVTLADALLILQNIANSKKYPIEDKYVKQCDVYNSGDGLTPMDALSIQKLDSKFISSLPESIMK